MTEPMLQIEGLSLWISRKRERLPILEGLSFAVREGERWAVAGESGAGKSMTVHALSALLPRDRVTLEGKILFRDRDGTVTDLLALPYGQRQAFCARRVSLIMQDSMNALNPYMTIGRQWGNVLRLHGKAADPRQARRHIAAQLPQFGISDAGSLLEKYPHQISGGMRQRIVVAMALESPARILLADEPTTALDTVNQRRIVELIRRLCAERQLTLLYVSHNLGILASLCTHAMVMRRGRIVEQGPADGVFLHPERPYTRLLAEETGRLFEGGAPWNT